MPQITSDGAEQDSRPTSGQNSTGETAETGAEGQAVPDPKQEPGDNNEPRGGMDASVERAAAEEQREDSPAPRTGADEDTPGEKATDDDGGEPGGELSEPGKSPVQGSLASSTDSAQEGSRVLRPEQRDGESASCSPPAHRAKPADRPEHGAAKRRASVELTSSDGEPLSRMDSEDRYVEVVSAAGGGLKAALSSRGGGAGSQHDARFNVSRRLEMWRPGEP